jgi:hypothetical protein
MSPAMSEETIFAAALELPDPAERAAYLDTACGDDVALRRRVEDLLRAHEAVDSLLDAPPGLGDATGAREAGPGPGPIVAPDGRAPAAEATEALAGPIAEGPGTRIGPYKLLQQIGEGGMGVVYMAEQEAPVRRKVALKIIKPGMDTGQVVAASRPSARRWR